MLRIAAWAGIVLIGVLCSSASAQFNRDDPRYEPDARNAETDPRIEEDMRLTDVLEHEAGQVEYLGAHELFDSLYEQGDRATLSIALSEYSWELLGYIDGMCERWHTLVDGGALDDPNLRLEADALRERCADLAGLCDEATGDTTFFVYTDRQFGWDEEERTTFREGQAEYARALRLVDLAEDPADLNRALTPCQRALDAARILGDTWGHTLAITLSAQIYAANGDLGAAASAMDEGLRLGRQIHDLDTVWLALSLRYAAAIESAEWQQAEDTLTEQYQLAVELDDADTATQVMDRLIELSEYRNNEGV
jgi:hypothetical protein